MAVCTDSPQRSPRAESTDTSQKSPRDGSTVVPRTTLWLGALQNAETKGLGTEAQRSDRLKLWLEERANKRKGRSRGCALTCWPGHAAAWVTTAREDPWPASATTGPLRHITNFCSRSSIAGCTAGISKRHTEVPRPRPTLGPLTHSRPLLRNG